MLNVCLLCGMQDPKQPGYQHSDGSLTPSYELVHRGTAELTDAWGDVGRTIPSASRAPKVSLLEWAVALRYC